MRLGSARFRPALDAGDVYKQRDQVLGKIHSARFRLIIHEVETEGFLHAKKAAVVFSACSLEVRTPQVRFIRLKAEHQAAKTVLEIFAREMFARARSLSAPVLTHDQHSLKGILKSPSVLRAFAKAHKRQIQRPRPG